MAWRSPLHSLFAAAARWHAASITRRFVEAVCHATATQDRLLADLIARNAASDFGRRHGFDRIRTYADYTAAVPLCSYADIAPYIDRVRNGETTALFGPGQSVLMFALTSGTTAQPKYIPVTQRVLDDWRAGWNIWGLKALLDHPGCMLRHIVQVTSPMRDHDAPSGTPCGAITGLLAATQKRLVRKYYTSPLAVACIADPVAKYYTIMRLAIPKDVSWLVTANPATLLLLARTADDHREQLIRDIHGGTLTDALPVDGVIRDALRKRLRPDPACAKRLEAAAHKHGHIYPRHYWNVGFVAHWTGGTMGLYASQFPKYYGKVPARDIGLIASEGRMSVPLEDGTPSGVLAVTSQFFEFIPVAEYGSAKPTFLRSHELHEGQEYFLVLTNASGFYRYDIGDRVRVTGWMDQAPLVEFLCRDAHTSSMAGEKLTEDQVVEAMKTIRDPSGATIDQFVLAPRWVEGEENGTGSISEGERNEPVPFFSTPRYRLYVEVSTTRHFDRLAERLDGALCKVSVEYDSKRKTLRLGPVELAELPAGLLAARDRKLREQRSRTSEQFKHQYLLPKPGLDEDLHAATTLRL